MDSEKYSEAVEIVRKFIERRGYEVFSEHGIGHRGSQFMAVDGDELVLIWIEADVNRVPKPAITEYLRDTMEDEARMFLSISKRTGLADCARVRKDVACVGLIGGDRAIVRMYRDVLAS